MRPDLNGVCRGKYNTFLKEGILTESAMTTFLTSIGTVLTSAVGWMTTVAGAVLSTPILLVPFALGLAFTGVALFKALRH